MSAGERLQCPFCSAYEVDRMYLASLRVDSCECKSCGARWDEEVDSGEFRGRSSGTRAATRRDE